MFIINLIKKYKNLYDIFYIEVDKYSLLVFLWF